MKDYPNILFLMFADGCIIFCRATKNTAREVKCISDHYYHVSSQSSNYHRSTIQFSIGIEKSLKSEIGDVLQIQNTGSISSYLGCFNIDWQPSKIGFPRIKGKFN